MNDKIEIPDEYTKELNDELNGDNASQIKQDLVFRFADKTQKRNQKLRDSNTNLRRIQREENRIYNYFEELELSLKNIIPVLNKSKFKPVTYKINNKVEAIIQLSDLHLNEIVLPEDCKNTNEYNWEIASKRLQKYAHECKEHLKFYGVKKVYIAITGDIFNSSRRFDEMIRNAHSGAVAVVRGIDLLSKFIQDILTLDVKVDVYSVFGNESRLHKDYTSVHWEHSLDFLCHYFMSTHFMNYKQIDFIVPTLDHGQIIPDILGANVYLMHGHNKVKPKDIILQYSQRDKDPVIINWVLTGHIHETKLTKSEKRSASLVGNNAYSYHQLGVHGSAEQNFHIMIQENENRKPILRTITMNLDCVDGFDGYEFMSYDEFTITNQLNGTPVSLNNP